MPLLILPETQAHARSRLHISGTGPGGRAILQVWPHMGPVNSRVYFSYKAVRLAATYRLSLSGMKTEARMGLSGFGTVYQAQVGHGVI